MNRAHASHQATRSPRSTTRSNSLPRKALWLSAAFLGAAGCEGESRPTGLVDASVTDIVLPDVVAADRVETDAAAPDVPSDLGADASADASLDGDVPARDVVFADMPIEECCVDAAMMTARPISPRSGGYSASRRPTFRWIPQMGAARYRVEVGATRTFMNASATFTTTGAETSLTAPMELPAGRLWWRVVPLDGSGAAMTPTATWSVLVGRVPNDLNGDGYADVVVGAPEHDAPMLTDIGRVQVFFGGGGLDTTADATLDGSAAGESFGRSLSTSGDLNGDGFADLVVGAPYAGVMQTGRVAIFFGGATIPTAPSVAIVGTQTMAQFGRNVSIAGDLNGDGYDDLLVSTPFFRGSGVNTGRAWVYFGGAAMDGVADVELSYASAGDQLGYASTPAGDFNGDGFLDVAVAAPRNGLAGVDSGAAYVWWGSSMMDTGVDVIILGLAPGARTGDAITSLGDWDADGYADLAIGAPGASVGGPNSGSVLGYAGGVGVIARPLFTLNGSGAERLGTALAGGGDLDADGFDDLVIGARDNSAGGALSGRAYAYRGSAGPMPTLAATYAVSMGMMSGGDEFGASVGLLGDANADGFDDVLVGAPNAPFSGVEGPGRVYFFAGGTALATAPRQTYVPATSSAFGQAVARR